MDGTPAKSSKMGLINLRAFEEANSLRYIALPKPSGNDTILDKTAIKSVPDIKGKTPNDGGSNTGAQRIVVKNSMMDTSLKNMTLSNNKLNTIPMVVKIEMDAKSARII